MNKLSKRAISILVITLLTLSISLPFVSALPQMPHQFYGAVTIDGVAAPDGTVVQARIGGVAYGDSTTSAGLYGWDPVFQVTADDPDTAEVEGGINGDTVSFYVGDLLAISYTYLSGGVAEVDLAVTSAAVDTGTLSITTTPVIGAVSVDGVLWGDAPQSQVVDVGSYTVSFGAVSGYTTPASQTAVVTADTTTSKAGVYVAIVVDDDDVIPTPEFSIDSVSAAVAEKGDTLTVIGSGVTAGTTVNVYWDYASGTNMLLLNTTEGDPDGTFELEIDVPSDTVGAHYLWATDTDTGETVSWGPLTMVPKITLSPSSGLVDDEITIKGYGYTDEANLTFTFGAADLTVSPSDVETDEDGYFTATFDVPDNVYATYSITVADFYGISDSADFILGASIILTPEEGPTGAVVVVTGRGWTEDANITFVMDKTAVQVVDDDVVTVDEDGVFSAEIVIPDKGTIDEYPLTATETGGAKGPAEEDFDVTGIPEVEVSPTYGAPGAIITVTGSNFTQIAGTEVTITLDSTPVSALVTAETAADGTFEATFISPAVEFATYTVTAIDEYSIDEDDAYKVGLIALIINPISGEAGTKIAITGIGFVAGTYNATFGDELYEDHGTVVGEAISDNLYAPNVAPGVYSLVIIDTDENELSVQFTVTESTTASIDPVVGPNDYNVSISGNNFADVDDGALTFEMYNLTDPDDWTLIMTVITDPAGLATVTDDDGNFTGYWIIPADTVLSLGDYTINITDSEDLMVQLSFSVVAARVDVTSRKALYDSGDTISFDISNDFDLPGSYIEIYSPDDTLYWITEPFTGVWVLVDDLYTVPYYRQTANMNLMDLQSDAPVGTWTYFFYDVDDDELMNGTFAVGPSTAAQVDALLEEVRSDLSGLAEDMAGLSDDFADDMDALSADFADDMDALSADFADDIAGLSDEIAAATDAGNAASAAVADLEDSLSDLEDSMDDIADSSNSALDAAQAAADAAADAASAAEGAGDAASGLTGLVYGAIGASLIAALAAIVSLMQISKKIAG